MISKLSYNEENRKPFVFIKNRVKPFGYEI